MGSWVLRILTVSPIEFVGGIMNISYRNILIRYILIIFYFKTGLTFLLPKAYFLLTDLKLSYNVISI